MYRHTYKKDDNLMILIIITDTFPKGYVHKTNNYISFNVNQGISNSIRSLYININCPRLVIDETFSLSGC